VAPSIVLSAPKLRVIFIGCRGDIWTLARAALGNDRAIGNIDIVAISDLLPVSGARAVDLVLIDLDAIEPERWRLLAENTLLAAPNAAIVGLTTFMGANAVGVTRFLRAPNVDVIFIDRDPVADLVLAHALDETRRGGRAAALRILARALPVALVGLYTTLIHRAGEIPNRDALARHAGIARTHLARLAHAHAGMSLGEIDRWIRLMLASALLEDGTFTVQHVARLVGFKDVRSLRTASRNLVGVTPVALKTSGACLRCGRMLAAIIQHGANDI
jgi:AraC-like DNA-binding protein